MQMDKFYIQFVRPFYVFMRSNEYIISHLTDETVIVFGKKVINRKMCE
jgi:hypothetical protein